MSQIYKIKQLIKSLPEKDIVLGQKFIQNRNFVALKELVDSAIYKIEKCIDYKNEENKYSSDNLEDLRTLQFEVNVYLSYLDEETDSSSIENNEIYEEKFY